jgi:hypothetical protein
MARFVLMFHGGESPEDPSQVMAKGCPGLSSGGSVRLYEARQMG